MTQLNVPAEVKRILEPFGLVCAKQALGDKTINDTKEALDTANAALLSLLEQVGKEIIGGYEPVANGGSEYPAQRNELREEQYNRLATLLKGEKDE